MIIAIIIGSIVALILLVIVGNKISERVCNKKGHNFKDRHYLIRKRSNEYRKVCTDNHAIIPRCTRFGCEAIGEVQILEEIDYYTSVSMPTENWRKMDKEGYIILDVFSEISKES